MQVFRPLVAVLVLGFVAVSCAGGGSETERAAGEVGTGGAAGCVPAAEAYLASNQMVDFAKAVRRCPTIADLARALDGRDITNTALSLMLTCTADASPGSGLPVEETAVTAPLCRQFRDQCVDIAAVRDAYRSGQGVAVGQSPDLDRRLQASGNKLVECERTFFGLEPAADEQPPATRTPDRAAAEAVFRTSANAFCDDMQQAMATAWSAMGPNPTEQQEYTFYHGPYIAETRRAAERIGALTIPPSMAHDVKQLVDFAYWESLHYENAPAYAIDDSDPYGGFNATATKLGLNRCADEAGS